MNRPKNNTTQYNNYEYNIEIIFSIIFEYIFVFKKREHIFASCVYKWKGIRHFFDILGISHLLNGKFIFEFEFDKRKLIIRFSCVNFQRLLCIMNYPRGTCVIKKTSPKRSLSLLARFRTFIVLLNHSLYYLYSLSFFSIIFSLSVYLTNK
jgi:hypothetical protein